LTSVAGYIVHTENTPTYMVTSQSTNQAQRRTTTLLETNVLPLSHTTIRESFGTLLVKTMNEFHATCFSCVVSVVVLSLVC